MFERVRALLDGEQTDEYVSPAQIAEDVNAVHRMLDDVKEWSLGHLEWLASEQSRLEDEGESEYAEELDDLMLYVQTVFMRIEYGDSSVRPSVEEGIEESGKTVDEIVEDSQ